MHKKSSIEVPIYLISLGEKIPARIYRLTLNEKQREALNSKEFYRVSNTRHSFVAFVTDKVAASVGWGLDVENLNKRLFRVSREKIKRFEDRKQKTSITSAA